MLTILGSRFVARLGLGLAALGCLAALLTHPATEAHAVELANPDQTLVIELETGKVYIEMRPDLAPKHVDQITALAREGFYDGVVFHRVIDGFMAQTGDPTGTGTGGSDRPDLPAEFSDAPFDRGVVGMARTNDPNSANSQFFIMFDDGHFLNGNYTVWGKVIEGMDHVDDIKRGSGQSGMVNDPDKMLRVYVAGDQPAN